MECIPLNPPGRALSPAYLHLLQASYINKSISCLTLCLLLNSFCAETQTTWATLSQGIRWVILIKRPCFKSQTGIWGVVGVLAMWLWVKTWCDRFQLRRSPCYPIENFKLWPVKLAHRARMKVTSFCISLRLDSQYLCFWVDKYRHCMPWKPPLCVYKI